MGISIYFTITAQNLTHPTRFPLAASLIPTSNSFGTILGEACGVLFRVVYCKIQSVTMCHKVWVPRCQAMDHHEGPTLDPSCKATICSVVVVGNSFGMVLREESNVLSRAFYCHMWCANLLHKILCIRPLGISMHFTMRAQHWTHPTRMPLKAYYVVKICFVRGIRCAMDSCCHIQPIVSHHNFLAPSFQARHFFPCISPLGPNLVHFSTSAPPKKLLRCFVYVVFGWWGGVGNTGA